MKKVKVGLGMQIFIGLVLGVVIGAIFKGNAAVAAFLQPFGDIFLRLIKMIVVPIVFSALVVAIAGSGDLKQVGKVGVKTLVYFEVVSTIAILLGLVIANVFHPGVGVDMSSLTKTSISNYVNTTKTATNHGFIATVENIVPTNIFESLSNGDMLPIIFFSIMFGCGISAVGERAKPVLKVVDGIAQVMFWITNQIMKTAPIGVFALIGVTVSKFGITSLIPLGKLVISVYGAMAFFILVVFGIIARLVGLNIFKLFKVIKDEMILAYSTASSESVLPRIMDKMSKFGCPKAIATFVIPTGYSFNLDGSTLYQAIAAIFIAQMYGIHLSIATQVNLVIVLMLTSKGIAGVPGVSFVVLLATLGSVGIPIQGLAFIAGIDRILDMARTCVNVVGNSLASIVISKWEHKYDAEQAERYLDKLSKPTGVEVA